MPSDYTHTHEDTQTTFDQLTRKAQPAELKIRYVGNKDNNPENPVSVTITDQHMYITLTQLAFHMTTSYKPVEHCCTVAVRR